MFKNRREAGQKLAEALSSYKDRDDVVILALPRGGVVVGYEIAEALHLPLDIVVPRKIGAPGNSEYAIGAITEDGETILNEWEAKKVEQDWLHEEMKKEQQEALRRAEAYRVGAPLDLKNKIVFIVDDGIATGYTMRAALLSVKKQVPEKIIIAVPHGAPESLQELEHEADEIIVILRPVVYFAVGAFYEEFEEVDDEKVKELLRKNQGQGKQQSQK